MALDFSQVTSVTIPEGQVTKIQINGVTVWESGPAATIKYYIFDKLMINPTSGVSHYRIPLPGIQLTSAHDTTAPVIELDFSFPSTLTLSTQFWGTTSTNGVNYRARLYNNSTTQLSCNIGNSNKFNLTWSSAYANVQLADYFYNNGYYYVYNILKERDTGTSIQSVSQSLTNTNYRNAIRTTDFAIGNYSSGFASNYAENLSVYGVRVWTGTWDAPTTIQDLVPAICDKDSAIGLVDLLSGKFYPVYDSNGDVILAEAMMPGSSDYDVLGTSEQLYNVDLPDVPRPQ